MAATKTSSKAGALAQDSAQVKEKVASQSSVVPPISRLDTIRVPEDAGEYLAGIRQILGRIPDRWGRQLRCQKGWYGILVELDKKLAKLDPDYVVLQAKEKFGGLRYYAEIGRKTQFTEPSYPSEGTEEKKAQWSLEC